MLQVTGQAGGVPIAPPRGRSVEFPSEGNHISPVNATLYIKTTVLYYTFYGMSDLNMKIMHFLIKHALICLHSQ